MSKTTLAVAPEVLHFDSTQESALRKSLSSKDAHTIHMDLNSPSDIRLDDTGKLRVGGFRFTTLALAQICQKLCPGLSKLIFTVSGLAGVSEDGGENEVSIPMAARIINDMVTLRFERIAGRQLVRDTRTGLIEGLTGTGYQFLSNKDFYDRVLDAVTDYNKKLVFHEANLTGRRLTVYFRHQKPAYITTGWSGAGNHDIFYEAYDLTNSETGECAVRTAPVFVIEDLDAVSLRGPKIRRLIHSGTKFSRNLVTALSRTLTDRDVFRGIGSRIEELKEINLGFAKLSEEAHKSRMSKFVGALSHQKMTRSSSERTMRVALYKKAYKSVQSGSFSSSVGLRTAYDLLVAIMCEAKQVPVGLHENVERAAYNLLIDKLHLPK